MNFDPIPEEIVALVHAISDDSALCEWLFSLEKTPPAVREAALRVMTTQMRAGGEDESLIRAVALLADPAMLGAVCSTLRDLRR